MKAATFTPEAERLLKQCRPSFMSAILNMIRVDMKGAGRRVPSLARLLTPAQKKAKARADAYHASIGFGSVQKKKGGAR